jgi:hypothetical protein
MEAEAKTKMATSCNGARPVELVHFIQVWIFFVFANYNCLFIFSVCQLFFAKKMGS